MESVGNGKACDEVRVSSFFGDIIIYLSTTLFGNAERNIITEVRIVKDNQEGTR